MVSGWCFACERHLSLSSTVGLGGPRSSPERCDPPLLESSRPAPDGVAALGCCHNTECRIHDAAFIDVMR
jgi:hypothetical protein